MKIVVPKNSISGDTQIDVESSLVIVGANGSGKTRFGSHIEKSNSNAKRISAQRMLSILGVIPRQDYETAKAQLDNSYKHRSPAEFQNDFDKVLISAFAEESKRNSNYVKKSRESKEKIPVDDSAIDKIIKIWCDVFPQRKIILKDHKVSAKGTSDSVNAYHASEMSDGEKVGLYLIAQVLLANDRSIIIVDEPELHLHKSLMLRLWNILESFRSDCRFIYITHDLDFAVSKAISPKIWVKDYFNGVWEWEFVGDHPMFIPENLFLEVIGSKKPVLFVEGDKSSLDYKIYQIVYPNFTIIPVGTCEKVIEAVKGYNTAPHLHNIHAFGIIDRDFRSEQELASLRQHRIYSINCSEIENILLLPDITDYVSDLLSKDPVIVREQIKNLVKERIGAQIERLSFKYLQANMVYNLRSIVFNSDGHDDLFVNLEEVSTQKDEYVDGAKKVFADAIASDDINNMLAVFPEKGLPNQIAGFFDLKSSSSNPPPYTGLILGKLNSDNKLRDIIKLQLPDIG